MATYYLKNTSGNQIIVNDLGLVLPDNSMTPIDSNAINGWLTGDLTTEIQASNLVLSTTDLSDNSGDMTAPEAIKALTITSEYDTDNPHDVTFTQAVSADPNTDVTTTEIESLTDGSDVALHTHDGRYYTISQLTNSNPASVNVHWDNITDTPSFGSFEWRAPVICRIIGQYSSAPPGSEGEYYLDTSDAHLYRHDGTSWIDQGVPAEEDRFIDRSDETIYEYDGTSWIQTTPVEGWSLLVEDDGDQRPAQYIYSDISGTLKWTKIADIDWGTHNQIGGRSDAGAHPGLAITYNNTLTFSNLLTTTVQDALDEINELISQSGEEVYVDNTRSDSYDETGSDDKPFKTITSAITELGNSGTINIAPGVYTENFTLPGNFTLKGAGAGTTIIEGDFTVGDGTPRGDCSIENLSMSGQLTVDISTDNKINVDRSASTGTVVITTGRLVAHSFPIKPSISGLSAVTIGSQGEFVNIDSTMESTGDVATISSTGKVTLSSSELKGSSTTPILQSSGGVVRLSFLSATNAGSGQSIDINNGATTLNPNFIQGVFHDSGIDLHDSITVVEGIYGSLPSGTQIIFRPATQISYDNSASGLSATNVQDAIDELSSETGVDFDGIVFVAKNGQDTSSDVTLGTMDNPYLTVQAAINEAQSRGGYQIVFVAPGLYEENVTVPAYVALYSFGKEPTRIGTSNTSNSHTFDFGNGGRVFVKNINLRNDGVVVNHDVGATSGVSLWFDNSNFGALEFNGRGVNDYLQILESCWALGKITVHSANIDIRDSIFQDTAGVTGDITLEFDDAGCENYDSNGHCGVADIKGSDLFFNLKLENNTLTRVSHTKIWGDVSTNGGNCKFIYDVASLGRGTTITQTNSSIVELDSEAKNLFFDSSSNTLVSTNTQAAIEEILGKKLQGVLYVAKNGNDGVSPLFGSILNPYATIQAAINRIEDNNDNHYTGKPYVIYVKPGTYPENVMLNDSSLNNIIIIAPEGGVYIQPSTGLSLECTGQNSNFKRLEFQGIKFEMPITFTGAVDNTTSFSDGLYFKDCIISEDVNITNIINVEFDGSKVDKNFTTTNVNSTILKDFEYDNTYLLSVITDTLSPNPSGFTKSLITTIDSKIYGEVSIDAESEIIARGSEIGDGSLQANFQGNISAYNSWLNPSSLVIGSSSVFKTQSTFFNKDVLVLDGVHTNNTKSDVVYYDDTITQLTADNVQDAIDNLDAKVGAFLVPHGTSFPVNPDGPALFYRTDYSIMFQYHDSRSKWLSTTQMFLDWGAGNADGKYLNIHGAAATQTGYLMPYSGTIISLTVKIASGNQDKTFEIRRNHDYANPLLTATAASGSYSDISLNIDFDQGDYIQAYATSVGIPARDVVVMATVVWRV